MLARSKSSSTRTPSKGTSGLKTLFRKHSGLHRLPWLQKAKAAALANNVILEEPKAPLTPELPTELLFMVFQHLADPSYFHALGYTYPDTRTYESTEDAQTGEEQLHIVYAMLVCRSWAKAGTNFLYSRPLLAGRNAILHFARTLAKSPGLASLVKHVIVADEGVPQRGSASWRMSMPLKQYLRNRTSHDTLLRRTLSSVLLECPALESLILAPPVQPDTHVQVVPPASSFLRVSASGAHLRKLMFYGHEVSLGDKDSPQLDGISFPVLEVLCLREVHLNRNSPFPSVLPSLHTLVVSKSHLTPHSSDKKLHIHELQFPSLKHVQLYDNSFSLTFDTSVYLRLERMFVLDTTYSSYIRGSESSGSQLAHAALGIFGPPHYSDAPMSLRIVPALETLSVAVSYEKDNEEHQFLRGLIGAVAEAGRKNTLKLKKIVLFTGYNEPGKEGIEGVFLALNETCELFGVEVVISDEGISPWVNRNLLSEFGL